MATAQQLPRAAARAPRAFVEMLSERTLALTAVVVFTGLALALRWIAAGESLSGDELFTYYEVTPSSLGHVFDRTDVWENSPPFFLILSWLAGKAGDPSTWIRFPSVIAGAATVPVIYLLGRAIDGRRTAITACALFAVMPFAVFYGSEARPYALLLLLVALSTLALLRALDATGRRGWWVAYWAASSLALYTHYIAGIVIALQAVWGLLTQPDRRREVLAVNAAIALAFLPWVPQIDDNTGTVWAIEALHPLTPAHVLTDPLRLAFGHPYVPFDQVPGALSIVLTCVAGAAVALGWFGAAGRSRSSAAPWRSGGSLGVPGIGWLLAALTAGILAVTLVYSEIAPDSIWEPRDVITILPYLCLLAGLVVTLLQERLAVVAGGALVVAALLASVRMLAGEPRPDLRAAARAIEDRAPPGTPVVEPAVGILGAPPQEHDLAIYLDDRYPISRPGLAIQWPRGREVWAVASAFQIRPHPEQRAEQVRAVARNAGARPIQTLHLDGFPEVIVTRYTAVGVAPPPTTAGGAASPLGAYFRQHPQELRAYLEQHPAARQRLRQALQGHQGAP